MKKCPYCAEDIQDEAIICRYCSHILEGTFHHDDKVQKKISDKDSFYIEQIKDYLKSEEDVNDVQSNIIIERYKSSFDMSHEGIEKARLYYNAMKMRFELTINQLDNLKELIANRKKTFLLGYAQWEGKILGITKFLTLLWMTSEYWKDKQPLTIIKEIPDGCGEIWLVYWMYFMYSVRLNMIFSKRTNNNDIIMAISIMQKIDELKANIMRANKEFIIKIENANTSIHGNKLHLY